jgi:type I restriction enzyme S subunit
VAIFRPSDGLQARWLHFVFQSQGFQRLLWQYVGYSAQPGIYLGTLGEFRVPVPLLPEQSAIVAFLDQQTTKVDTLIAESQTAISLLHERRMAIISAAVTGKIDVRGLVGVQPEEVGAE